jgi:LL-diaminopimelate aminotransferase
MATFEQSKRLQALPPYLFAQIDKKKKELRAQKIDFVDVSIGDPDILAPGGVLDAMYAASKIKNNQKYALDAGKPEFAASIKKWFFTRFGVKLEDSEILPLIGSKEGLVHFPLAFVNPGEYIIVPSPGYPGYRGAASFAGAKVYELPLKASNNFLPDLDKIPAKIREKAKMIFLNYPNNPTTALASMDFLQKLVAFCKQYNIIIAYDNAYSEVYFDEKPHSILEVEGAKDIAIEFHSLSKTFCMTGFRVGWACGNADLVKGLLRVKTNVDSGIFGAIQDAAAYALEKEMPYTDELRKKMRERRDFFVKGLKKKGLKAKADSTFYVWAKVPKPYSSIEFSEKLLAQRVVATPGVGFGKYGEGYIRFAMTVDIPILQKALDLIDIK